MKTVEAGTVIGECECASCGSIRPLKTTKKGTVGFRCGQWITNEDGTKYQCSGSSWLSKQASHKLINEYLNNTEENKNDVQQFEDRETIPSEGNGNDAKEGHDDRGRISNDKPAREQSSGIFGTLFNG